MDRFTRDDILALLEELGDRLEAKGIQAEVFVLGGSALALAYNTRRATADIDALFVPVEAVQAEALAMAREKRLPKDWLNDAVGETLHGVAKDDSPRDVLTTKGVSVKVASPEYILALKAMVSGRELEQDLEDAAFLCTLLGISSEDRLEALVRRYFTSGGALGARELRFERIIERAKSTRATGVMGDTTVPKPLVARCDHWMRIAKRHCALPAGHRGQHR